MLLGCASAWQERTAANESLAPPGSVPTGVYPVTADAPTFGSVGPGNADCYCCDPIRSGWFAGADYRLLRTHFSEAVAFATLTAGAGSQGPDLSVTASELDFDYQSSFALFAGYHINDNTDVKFSYWHLDTSTGVSGAAGPGQVIVDPFGNLAPGGNRHRHHCLRPARRL